MKVNVTKEDIEKANKLRAKKGDEEFDFPCHCPIAQAVKRQTKKSVSVYGYFMTLAHSRRYNLPFQAESFIDNWDAGSKKVKPFTFEATLG